jgi:uncharacterized lipoprotein YbaY
METRVIRNGLTVAALGILLVYPAMAQDPAAAGTQSAPAQPHNNVKMEIKWKQFDYTCAGSTKLTVYLHDQLAKVRYEDRAYLMKQTPSADGGRYSDGKVVWWGKGNGGFLQEDTPDGDGRMIVQGCQLDKPLNAQTGTVTGTVSYLQRVALPPNAVIQVQLLDVSVADAPANVMTEETIDLGRRQVPVPFTLTFDPMKIDPKHSYSVRAKITVEGALRFTSDHSYPVLTAGKPAHAELILQQVPPSNPN